MLPAKPTLEGTSAVDPEVLLWRVDRLVRVGFRPALAHLAAADPRVDVHELIVLVERGCPPELAWRILAPLDSP